MKTLLVSGLLALFLVGCGNNSDTKSSPAQTNASTSGNPITAPVDYLGAVARGQQMAIKTIDLASINQAIQLFQADKGRNPKDLNELVQEGFLGRIPQAPYGMKIVYDPKTAQVSVVKQ